ncbi:MAG: GPO family capsid scaffolding protein [Pigmentiphaga sp.]
MAKKTFRIATEGATTDGRTISADWLRQMAKNYDPKKYGARINLEHFRGVLPDGPFKAYGDVISLKVEEIEMDGGKRLALFAELDPTPELIEFTKKRQKVYTSMEVDPDFAKSGEAYLVGLAVTDSPASLGTEMLKFASGASTNPFAARKQSPGNLFSEAVEIALDFTDASPNTDDKGLFAKVKDLLGGIGNKFAASDARLQDAHQAIELLADNQRQLADQVGKVATLSTEHTALKAAHDKLKSEFADVVAKLAKETPPNFTPRPNATGGDGGGAQVTDC